LLVPIFTFIIIACECLAHIEWSEVSMLTMMLTKRADADRRTCIHPNDGRMVLYI